MYRRAASCCCVQDDDDVCGTPWSFTNQFGTQFDLEKFVVTIHTGFQGAYDCLNQQYGNFPTFVTGEVSTGIREGFFVGVGGAVNYDTFFADSVYTADAREIAQQLQMYGDDMGPCQQAVACGLSEPRTTDSYFIQFRYVAEHPLGYFDGEPGYVNQPPICRGIVGTASWFDADGFTGASVQFAGTGYRDYHCKCHCQSTGEGEPVCQAFEETCAHQMSDYEVSLSSKSGIYFGCPIDNCDSMAVWACTEGCGSAIPQEVCDCYVTACAQPGCASNPNAEPYPVCCGGRKQCGVPTLIDYGGDASDLATDCLNCAVVERELYGVCGVIPCLQDLSTPDGVYRRTTDPRQGVVTITRGS